MIGPLPPAWGVSESTRVENVIVFLSRPLAFFGPRVSEGHIFPSIGSRRNASLAARLGPSFFHGFPVEQQSAGDKPGKVPRSLTTQICGALADVEACLFRSFLFFQRHRQRRWTRRTGDHLPCFPHHLRSSPSQTVRWNRNGGPWRGGPASCVPVQPLNKSRIGSTLDRAPAIFLIPSAVSFRDDGTVSLVPERERHERMS